MQDSEKVDVGNKPQQRRHNGLAGVCLRGRVGPGYTAVLATWGGTVELASSPRTPVHSTDTQHYYEHAFYVSLSIISTAGCEDQRGGCYREPVIYAHGEHQRR